MWALFSVILTLAGLALGYPSAQLEERYDGFPNNLAMRLGQYIPPTPSDARGPCPGLNTLANHGLIPRNGRNIKSSLLRKAFPRGFGINPNGITVAINNFEVVCAYVNGRSCAMNPSDPNSDFLLTNLTLLGLPHAFEHDHSYSRGDYQQSFANGGITDNISFNATEFQVSLNAIGYTPTSPPTVALANVQQFNEIRLARESFALQNDFPGSFLQTIPTTLFETGFIFGAMYNRNRDGSMIGKTPLVRVDWWNFWFSEESFPTALGWVPSQTEIFDVNFITSVSKAVLQAPVTSTPVPLPVGATSTSFAAPSDLPNQDPSPTNPLYVAVPYVAPTNPAAVRIASAPGGPASQPAGSCGSGATVTVTMTPGATLSPSIPTQTLNTLNTFTPTFTANPTGVPTPFSTTLTVTTPPPTLKKRTAGAMPSAYDWYQVSMNLSKMQNQIAAQQSWESEVQASMTVAKR